MKDLNKLFTECMKDVKAAGLKPGNIVDVSVNSRAKKRWGLCRESNGMFSIEVSNRLLDDSLDDIVAKNTIVHEILHTCPGSMNHGKTWQDNADIMNHTYGGYYTIKRTTSAAEKGLEAVGRVRQDRNRYALRCYSCGHTWYFKRQCKTLVNYKSCCCGRCHTGLELIVLGE